MAFAPQLSTLSRLIAAAAVSTGCLVSLTWMLNLPGLARIHPILGAMSPRAAFCFILSGTALLLVPSKQCGRRRRLASHACASILVAVSVLTLAQAYGWGREVDELFHQATLHLFPGRMPVPTALVFLAFGLALLGIDVEIGRARPTEFLTFLAALIALLALFGYAFSFVSFFDIPSRRPLAFHTVILMLLFSFGLLAARPRRGLMRLATGTSVGGVMVRRMLPAAVGVPILAGWIILEGQRGGWYPPVLSLPYYTLLIITAFTTLIWATAVSLHRLDIRRREAEEKVTRLNAELEQRVTERTLQLETANRELEAFSYSVSHDLRAPLRHIDGFAQLLAKQQAAAGEDPNRYLALISQAVGRMGELIDGLLSFSRMARTEMMNTRVDLNAIVRSVRSEIEAHLDDREIRWTVHELPEMRGDAAMLKQVFTNLMSNAVKYSRGRQPAIIEIGASRTSTETIVYVRDNGVGFDMQYVGKLFGVFQRLHRAEDFEGTGIGLANVQRIMLRHGGRVWAEAKLNEGATFYLAFPS